MSDEEHLTPDAREELQRALDREARRKLRARRARVDDDAIDERDAAAPLTGRDDDALDRGVDHVALRVKRQLAPLLGGDTLDALESV